MLGRTLGRIKTSSRKDHSKDCIKKKKGGGGRKWNFHQDFSYATFLHSRILDIHANDEA